MIKGKSVEHVCQDEGKIYSKEGIKGYYNNLTEKVTRFGLNDSSIPATIVDQGKEIYFSIAIFQYGLGAYDVYLINKDIAMLEKSIACANWAVDNQQDNGAWLTFAHVNPEYPYSSMAQGEAISLLLRIYQETGEQKYLDATQKAKDFMLLPLEKGGTTKYLDDEVLFYEYTNEPLVLNGWIFSIWGIWDYVKFFNSEEESLILKKTLASLEKKLADFDIGYWSKYDEHKRITSPFYHRLHIAQLKVMYDLTGKQIYLEYAEKWERYQKSFWKRKRAFIRKALQKVFE